jgi:hypothetical protein
MYYSACEVTIRQIRHHVLNFLNVILKKLSKLVKIRWTFLSVFVYHTELCHPIKIFAGASLNTPPSFTIVYVAYCIRRKLHIIS